MTGDRPGPGLGRNTTCRSCQAPIAYGLTRAEKRIPLDVDDHGRPRLELKTDGSGARMVPNVAIVDGYAEVRAAAVLIDEHPPTLVPHHATCPHAADWKGPKR